MNPQAAVFNASGGFVRKPFLELTEKEFAAGYDVSVRGAFLFSQATLPLLLKGVEQKSQHPPSLIFTGATASVKSNALMATFATGKCQLVPSFSPSITNADCLSHLGALRALSQSLAREFGPQGVHVSHAIIDGVIDTPRIKVLGWKVNEGKEDGIIQPDAIA